MTSAAFNTLQYTKDAEAVGFSREQAEFQALKLAEILTQELATKKDIAILSKDIDNLSKETKKDIDNLSKETKKDIDNLSKDIETLSKEADYKLTNVVETLTRRMKEDKIDTIKWMIGIIIAQSTFFFAMFSNFGHLTTKITGVS